MKLMIVHPGAAFSTSDVYDGVVYGLRQCANVEVLEARLDTILSFYAGLRDRGVADGIFNPAIFGEDFTANISALASAHITRYALIERPDWLIVVSGHNYHTLDAIALGKIGIKTAVVLTESPYWRDFEIALARRYNVVFTNERNFVDTLRRTGNAASYYLPHAYHPERHTAVGDVAHGGDALFIGSLFDERRTLFDGVNWEGIEFIRRGVDVNNNAMDVVANASTAAYYRGAKIAVNHHRTTTSHGTGQHIARDAAQSLGPRAYEIAACGAFQLCDDSRSEARDVFGDALATYRSGDSADLEAKIRYYLSHEDERIDLARAQHDAVVRGGHHWGNRGTQMMEILQCHSV